MCRLSSSEYGDLYRRTNSGAMRALFEWLRELWRTRRPQPATAEVVRFPAEAEHKAGHEDSKAA